MDFKFGLRKTLLALFVVLPGLSNAASTATPTVTPVVNPLTCWPQISGNVISSTYNGDHIYLAGSFTSVHGSPRSGLALWDAAAGDLVPGFAPSVVGGDVYQVEIHDGWLYVVGAFTQIGGVSANGVARMNPLTGAVDSGFTPSFESSPQDLAFNGSIMYAVGTFATANGSPMSGVAAIDVTTGNLVGGFGSGSTTNGWVRKVLFHNGRLFVTGSYTQLFGTTSYRLSELDPATGAVLGGWTIGLNEGTANTSLWLTGWALYGYGDILYVGGQFTSVDGVSRSNLAAIDLTTDSLISWAPSVDVAVGTTNRGVQSLGRSGNVVYGGGYMHSGALTTHPYLVRVDASSGTILATTVNPNGYLYARSDPLTRGNELFLFGPLTSPVNQNGAAVDEVVLGECTLPTPTATVTPTSTVTSTSTVTPSATLTWTPTITPSPSNTSTPAPVALLSETPQPGRCFVYPAPVTRGRRASIALHLPCGGEVAVSIWNARGDLAAEVKGQAVGAGSHVFELPTQALASGVYFYKPKLNLPCDGKFKMKPGKFLVRP